MAAKVKCIIKRPDERYGHMTNISTTLENLQKTVDGPIESVTISDTTDPKLILICNEEGKIRKLERNFRIGSGWLADTIVGTVIIIGADKEGELVDIPISYDLWKEILKGWSN